MQNKLLFIYECKFESLPSARDNVHVHIYTGKTRQTFLYTKKGWQFQWRFYVQKARYFNLRDFLWNFWSWHFYIKSMSLCVTWRFYIQKAGHFAKSKTICVAFLYTKSGHFALRDFSLNFWNWRRWGEFLYSKFNALYMPYIFIWLKQFTLLYVFMYKKPDTLRYIFISNKQCTLRYVFISKIYPIVLIPNYKRTYDQTDQIEK